jgi:hypothetical protein
MPPFIVTCHYLADKYLRCAIDAPTRQAAENEVRLALSTETPDEEPPFDIRVLTATYTIKNMRTEEPKSALSPTNGTSSPQRPRREPTPLDYVRHYWRVLETPEVVQLVTEQTTPEQRRQILAALGVPDEEPPPPPARRPHRPTRGGQRHG